MEMQRLFMKKEYHKISISITDPWFIAAYHQLNKQTCQNIVLLILLLSLLFEIQLLAGNCSFLIDHKQGEQQET